MAAVAGLFLAGASIAQTNHTFTPVPRDHFCAEPQMTKKLLEEHPERRAAVEAATRQLDQYTSDYISAHQGLQRSAETTEYVIPVVFHIIHNNGPENISYAQIQDEMNILNQDYNKQNADTADVINQFKSIVANVGITFKLAQLDPNGNCTNGVVRVQNTDTYSGGENLKQDSPIWDRTKYLNVWVCQTIASGAAGYSMYPPSVADSYGATIDGVVIQDTYIGSIGTGDPTRSRALTHEVGHWLNLKHPWGDSNTPGDPANCGQDDGVADTPNTIGHTTCDLYSSTCGSLDNVQNYMDYSYCADMFTEGQKARMLAALTSPIAGRSNIWTQANLEATGVAGDPILCHADFTTPNRFVCAGDSVAFTDLSYNGVSTWSWNISGASPSNPTVQNPHVVFNSPGTYSVELTAGNGTGTVSTTKSNYITVLPSPGMPVPYQEGFQSYSSIPNNKWRLDPTNSSNTWQLSNVGAGDANSIYIHNRTKSSGEVERIMSNPIDLSNSTTDVTLTFKYAYAQRSGATGSDQLKIYLSYNCGGFWSIRKTMNVNMLQTAPATNGEFVPTSDQWQTATVSNITSPFLVSNARLMFEFTSGSGNNIYIDDINISEPGMSGLEEVLGRGASFNVQPNPSVNDADLALQLPQSLPLKIELYDLTGRAVQQIYNGNMAAGFHRIQIPRNGMSKGLYLIHLTSAGKQYTSKLIFE